MLKAIPPLLRDRSATSRVAALSVVMVLLSGCASTLAPHNQPTGTIPADRGYHSGIAKPSPSPESVLVGLSFSGGGTRAAALAYGVMEELAKTKTTVNGKSVRALDLVEHISAVSGGSYPAAYYGLFGDRLFEDFEAKFLKRDIQGEIADAVMSPTNLVRMTSPYFGRSDVTAEFLDQALFEGKTFADMEHAVRVQGRPFVVINATDIARTSRFEFTQDLFDLLCSDLGSYKVSRAVAASSAVPVVFSPITLRNYASQCKTGIEKKPPADMAKRDVAIRRRALLADIQAYRDEKQRKYIHLLDGGLADNLGLRFMLDKLTLDSATELSDRYGRPRLRRIVQIVVNAQVRPVFPELDHKAEVPTLRAITFSIANTVDRFSVETLAYARSSMEEAAKALTEKQREQGDSTGDDVQVTLIEIAFDNLEDRAEREYFNALETSFNLPPEAVDKLREVGARLLRQSPEYQKLLSELPHLR
ncbi:NTE family protein [Formivibrio citricus]|uniref:NTE family protein n=1 Tax=Formivibrio citricus TaxID=83765 RepID=A0A1I4UYN4_9NEIS|nr:patatin-like phospholipase family protein [Formivibrio citricus]SFM94046.1 NTE family protein [Formivibrio citricus]